MCALIVMCFLSICLWFLSSQLCGGLVSRRIYIDHYSGQPCSRWCQRVCAELRPLPYGTCNTACSASPIIPHPFAVALSCLSTLEGGGWALVRRVGQGNVWSSATDNLAGTASFGVTSSKPVDTTSLSIPFSQWLWPSTEMLFATGLFSLSR